MSSEPTVIAAFTQEVSLMAGYRGHISTAVVVSGLMVGAVAISPLAASLSPAERLVKGSAVVWIAVMFSLFPDVDIKSKGQALFYRLVFALDCVLLAAGRYLEAALLGLLALIPILSRHRGWTHTLWAAVLVPAPILAAPAYLAQSNATSAVVDALPYYLGAVVGYVSHLVTDGTLSRYRGGTP